MRGGGKLGPALRVWAAGFSHKPEPCEEVGPLAQSAWILPDHPSTQTQLKLTFLGLKVLKFSGQLDPYGLG